MMYTSYLYKTDIYQSYYTSHKAMLYALIYAQQLVVVLMII